MTARTRRLPEPPSLLVIQWEREGEEPVRIEVANGEKAILRAVTLLMTHRQLKAGDRLTILPADPT